MGCICSKGFIISDNNGKDKDLKLSKSSKRFVGSLRRDEVVVEAEGGSNDASARLISSPIELENEGDKKASVHGKALKSNPRRAATMDVEATGGSVQLPPKISRVGSLPHGEKGAQIVAGWPSWLASVAGEAINGWVPRRADSFEKLEKIGQGTYSSVYRARDLDTNKIVALKKVRFANMDPESVRFMAREILILRRLDHPNVMKLEGLITSRVSGSLYLIFDYMEHDLAGLAATPGVKFSDAQIKCYMQQLLHGLEHCHSHGVLHRDIKGSNLLIDNNGNLKIADFGLATFFRQNQKQPLTSRVVTLWYRPPELLLGSTDYGEFVDLWSSGCILAEMFAGKPIMPGRTEVEQLHKIFKLCGSPSEEYWKKSKLPHSTIFKPQQPYKRCLAETYKDFPLSALVLLDVLLAIEPQNRGTASSALQNEFFTTKPLPCDPSTLPKYPPSKEFDAKLRNDEARRRKAAAGKGRVTESTRRGIRESRAVPAPDANAELQTSVQKRKGQSNAKSSSEKYNNEEDGGSGFPIEPSRGVAQNTSSYSSQSMLSNNIGSSRMTNVNEDEALIIPEEAHDLSQNGVTTKTQRSHMHRKASHLSWFSNSVAVRGTSHYDGIMETNGNSQWEDESFNGQYNHLNGGESSGKHDWAHSLLDGPKSSYKKGVEHSGKEFTSSYSSKKNRIHYSGPLVPPGGNLDDILKEHEKQIQHAVRKARLDKTKTKRDVSDNGQRESLLHYGRSGR